MPLLKVERLDAICRVVGASPFLKNGSPLSVVFIGPSGVGKSELILKHVPPDARVINDFTFASLVAILQTRPLPAWIIVPDFNAVLAHKPHVVELAMGLMLALMGEGVTEIPGIDGHAKLAIERAVRQTNKGRGIHIGFITAMTPEMFFQKRGPWRKTGFLRRVIPINYTYGLETSRAIQFSIEHGIDSLDYAHEKLKKIKRADVTIPVKISRRISTLSENITERQLVWTAADKHGTKRITRAVEFPFTLHKTLRVFVKAHALLRGRPTVNEKDYAALLDFAKFVRFDHPEEL